MSKLRSNTSSRTKAMPRYRKRSGLEQLLKTPSGIQGLDEVTGGGLPKGRSTLVCGGPGCGKTLFALEFLVRGSLAHDEPGVMISFEETEAELKSNVASLGFDLQDLIDRKKLQIDCVDIERTQIEETGEFDLEGLFIRMDQAVSSIGAKRVVLDTMELLFAGFANAATLRVELQRLFRWLKDRELTAVITSEQGEGKLTWFDRVAHYLPGPPPCGFYRAHLQRCSRTG